MGEESIPNVVPLARGRHLLGRDWDAVVIGSGVGGLSAAVLLASRGGMRVLVVERHYATGGFTQTFRRRRDEFEVGVHYIGEVGRTASPLRRVFDRLTEKRLAWAPFGPIHDRVLYDGEEVLFGDDEAFTREQLVRYSPGEASVVDRYLTDVRACAREAPPFLLNRSKPIPLHADVKLPFHRFSDVTTAEYLDGIGASRRLQELLTYSFANHGTTPEKSSFAAHAVATGHYLDGASFPVGGGGAIAREMIATLGHHGGVVLTRASVEEIRVRDGRVAGVTLEDGSEIDANLVVSDAGLAATAGGLLGEGVEGADSMREVARRLGPTLPHCALYLGLSKSPSALGLDRANIWQTSVPPSEALGAMERWIRGEVSAPSGFFLSKSCASDPTWDGRSPGRASVVALMAVPWAPFAPWADLTRGRRGADYEALKARLTREALAAVKQALPTIADAVDHVELSTPVTTRTFGAHPHGETAGLCHSPLRFRLASTARTPIRGLVLAGQDAWLSGVGGAVFGGVAAASYVLRRDLTRELIIGR